MNQPNRLLGYYSIYNEYLQNIQQYIFLAHIEQKQLPFHYKHFNSNLNLYSMKISFVERASSRVARYAKIFIPKSCST